MRLVRNRSYGMQATGKQHLRARFAMKIVAVLFTLSIANTATAQANSIEMDALTSQKARETCDGMAARFASTCRSFGYMDGIHRVHGWTAGWFMEPAPSTSSYLYTVYFCELPNTYVPGTHKCADGYFDPRFGPKTPGLCWPCVGNPVSAGTGNKVQTEVDVAPARLSAPAIVRIYNSTVGDPLGTGPHLFGPYWTTKYDVKVVAEPVRKQLVCVRSQASKQLLCGNELLILGGAGLAVTRADNKVLRFARLGGGYTSDPDIRDVITEQKEGGNGTTLGYTYFSAANSEIEQFDADGRLIAIKSRAGTTQTLTYSDGISNDTNQGRLPATAPACSRVRAGTILPRGRLLCVTDNWGAELGFAYDAAGLRVTTVYDPNGLEYTYSFGISDGCVPGPNVDCGPENLTQVTYPDLKTRSYLYNERAMVNQGVACPNTQSGGADLGHLPSALTGIVDENGVRFATWTYGCEGNATSSQHAGGVDLVKMTMGTASNGYTNTITSTVGRAESPVSSAVYLGFTTVNGVAKYVSGGGCADCPPLAAATYDTNGNMTSTTTLNSVMTCFAYDQTRNLQTGQIEGLGAGSNCASMFASTSLPAPARKTTTQWHSALRLPVLVAEPNKITRYDYDGSGNVLSRTEQATTDNTGVLGAAAVATGPARTWTSTYNSVGQLLTTRGPRRDIDDTAVMTYDAHGNLASIRNALAQTTMLSDYDANGRVGRIVDANGVITTLAYFPRGWIRSRSITADGVTETTTYDYDGVGQVKKITTPDGSVISYTYDDAHRLTDIADSNGNTIHYVLDLRGNRVAEQTRDPAGALTRQISREFDNRNRLKSVTGGAQ